MTWIWSISTIARLVSLTAPGTTALADVLIAHMVPIAVDAVAAHGVITGNGISITVAASVPPPEQSR